MRRTRDSDFPDNGFEAWGGYMKAKVAKLEEQYIKSTELDENKISSIFNGISIFVNGYTNPSADELKKLMSKHGGTYHSYQRKEDYIIASNLPDTKVKRLNIMRVIKPEWITHSIAAGKLLDYKEYLLYSKHTRTQPKLNFSKSIKNKELETVVSNQTHEENISSESKEGMVNESCNDENNATEEHPKEQTSKEIVICDNDQVLNSIVLNTGSHQVPNSHSKSSVARTAVDPLFLTEFYNNSRLHHISQLGAAFKQYVNELRDVNDFKFSARNKLRDVIVGSLKNSIQSIKRFSNGEKIIMHIDMDCFFVSVGLRNHPELRGKPVAVTHSKGGQNPNFKRFGVDRNAEIQLYRQRKINALMKSTGLSEDEILNKHTINSKLDNVTSDMNYSSLSEIASCSYEARAKGLHNGMFVGAALRLCPDLITIPYDFEGYKEVAYTLYNTVAQYSLDIEAVSCDEMYVDCSELISSLNVDVNEFARALRQEIKEKTGCPCSTGFGGNRLQARLATKRAKPDGQYILMPDMVDEFMMNIKLCDLPGVGHQTSRKLSALGYDTCGSLQSMSLTNLQQHLGHKTGAQLYDQCHGRDRKPLTYHTVRKSVSAEVNYGIRFENYEQCETFLKQLSEEVHNRMKQFKVTGKSITLKLMIRAVEAPVETAKFMGHGFCDTLNKTSTLMKPTNDVDIITKEVISLCKKQKIDPKEVRGIGIQVSKLESTVAEQSNSGLNKFFVQKQLQHQHYNAHDFEMVRNRNSELSPKKPIPKSPHKQIYKSPIKQVSKSPLKQRSPIKSPFKKSLGLTNRRRGRPPKNALTSNLRDPTSNLMHKFLNGENINTNLVPFDSLDQEILAALPPDIFQEVMDQYQIADKKSEIKESPQKSPVIEQKPTTENESDVTKRNTDSDMLALSWRQVREMLRAWLSNDSMPLQCDIDLISSYMQNMVIERKIDKLMILIKFLKRKISEINCTEWTKTYDLIIDGIQHTMTVIYGNKLLISD